jgi:pimeloyl-ACP methyl ester carboxylesterase
VTTSPRSADDGVRDELAEAPTWFLDALAQEPERGSVEVAGVDIATLAWGPRDAPTVVLVHGGAAHARWWSAIAPALTPAHRVVALDLSGHGDSGRRERYRVDLWAEEILAAGASAGGRGRPIVVGHSMGGFMTIVVAANHGDEVEGAIVMDAPVSRPDPESVEGRGGRMFREPKTYPDLDTAVEHFHLVPPQPCDNHWLLDHVARHSLREVEDGRWTWKFDKRMFVAREGPSHPSEFAPQLAKASCRLAIVNGERSDIVDDDVRAYMTELLAGSPAATAGIPFVEVPEARHHLLLDQPLATITALRGVLASWHPVGAPPKPVTGASPRG